MATSTPTFFNNWKEVAFEAANAETDQFRVALTNSAPAATMNNLTNLTGRIESPNLDGTNPTFLTTAASSQTAGTYRLDFNDITLTCASTGDDVGPFRYIAVYDDTVADDPLVAWLDYGSSITLGNSESLEITFNAAGFYTAT